MMSEASIADRIFSTFPAGQYCLPALLQVMSIVETRDVPTACIECVSQPRLFINPDFVARHAATPEKLLMLVMHELHHVMLGHTRLCPRVEWIDNLVFDAVINAMLCNRFAEHEYTSLFTDFYRPDVFPECFLRPPPGWGLGHRPSDGPVAVTDRPRHHDLATLHCELYSVRGATYSELREAFLPLASDPDTMKVVLLGDHRPEMHDASSDGGVSHRSPMLVDELQRAMSRWPHSSHVLNGGLAGAMRQDRVRMQHHATQKQLEHLLHLVGRPTRHGTVQATRQGAMPVSSAVPRHDRRSLVLAGLGGRTLMHRADTPTPEKALQCVKVHVYLDVSGSVEHLIGPLHGAILASRELVHPVVHQFSTRVADATLDELRRGIVRTTGGTSIECVARHMKRFSVTHAVLITDGFVGDPSAKMAAVLRSAVLGVALTPGQTTRGPLRVFANHWTTLEGITP